MIRRRVSNSDDLFDKKALETEIINHFWRIDQENKKFKHQELETLYKISNHDKFMGNSDLYWKDRLQPHRFKITQQFGILYRPKIIQDLMDMIRPLLSNSHNTNTTMINTRSSIEYQTYPGIVVKGPHGIGKSHSMVNLFRRLHYDGQYLVTFIPDCAQWETSIDLLDFICESFGSTRAKINLKSKGLNKSDSKVLLTEFIKYVDRVLEGGRKKWIFIFDHVDILFSRNGRVRNRFGKLESLPMPFSLIKNVIKPHRILSIICTSTDNDEAYEDHHDGFEEYDHPRDMTADELKVLYPVLRLRAKVFDLERIFLLTGYVPIHVYRFLAYLEQGNQIDEYIQRTREAVKKSLIQLRKQSIDMEWQNIVQVAISCLLRIPVDYTIDYDRNYTYLTRKNNATYASPLFALAEDVYREFFWEDLMTYLEHFEGKLLKLCGKQSTTEDTKSRIFKNVVVWRCIRSKVRRSESASVQRHSDNKGSGISIVTHSGGSFHNSNVEKFSGRFAPLPQIDGDDGECKIYVPTSTISSLNAVDMVWVRGDVVCAVQVIHRDYEDVLDRFITMCEEQDWFSEYMFHDKICLTYLSPTSDIAKTISKNVRRKSERNKKVRVVFASCRNFSFLKDLRWPRQRSNKKKASKK